jgi:SAM-dependent methyltransferase
VSSADAAADDESALPVTLRSDHRSFQHATIYDAADWYDVDYAGYRAELPFYSGLLTRHCPAPSACAVELGAGTGRLTIPLVQQGYRVFAVEPAVAMRALLTHKATAAGVNVELEDATAATFVGPRFAAPTLVFFPFNGLLHLPTRDALTAAFSHVRGRLAVGGRFAFDITSPYWESMARGLVPWGRADERVHPRTGRRFVTADRSRYDRTDRVMHIDIRYAFIDGDEAGVQTALSQRMWTFPEVLSVLDACGFDVEDVHGDVDGARFDDGSPRLLACAQRR